MRGSVWPQSAHVEKRSILFRMNESAGVSDPFDVVACIIYAERSEENISSGGKISEVVFRTHTQGRIDKFEDYACVPDGAENIRGPPSCQYAQLTRSQLKCNRVIRTT